MSKNKQATYPRSKREVEINAASGWLVDVLRAGGGTAYFMTMTFDPYQKLYLVTGGTEDELPCRADIAAGLTRAMPTNAKFDSYKGDCRRFYLRLLRALLGSRYSAQRDRQPVALGWLDNPVGKGSGTRSAFTRRSGDVFDHAHFVIVLDDNWRGPSGQSVHERFLELYNSGALQRIWQRFNPAGEIHLKQASDIHGAVDYAAKTAKRSDDFLDYLIELPFLSSRKQ